MATISGTSGNDTITPEGGSHGVTGGTPSDDADIITGSGGNDLIDGGGGVGDDGGFKDVVLGLGLDYNFAESWKSASAIAARSVTPTGGSLADEEGSSHPLFGGVVVNYRF